MRCLQVQISKLGHDRNPQDISRFQLRYLEFDRNVTKAKKQEGKLMSLFGPFLYFSHTINIE